MGFSVYINIALYGLRTEGLFFSSVKNSTSSLKLLNSAHVEVTVVAGFQGEQDEDPQRLNLFLEITSSPLCMPLVWKDKYYS